MLLVFVTIIDQKSLDNNQKSIGLVMVPELIEDNSVPFNLEDKYKTANMNSFIITEISPEVLE